MELWHNFMYVIDWIQPIQEKKTKPDNEINRMPIDKLCEHGLG